ncbi:MAG: hypothetical protein J6Y02_04590 [Pseudobutyrivibrio sp.]|nr:hypothetical protein [Pseudobutyrivibrio sp.]
MGTDSEKIKKWSKLESNKNYAAKAAQAATDLKTAIKTKIPEGYILVDKNSKGSGIITKFDTEVEKEGWFKTSRTTVQCGLYLDPDAMTTNHVLLRKKECIDFIKTKIKNDVYKNASGYDSSGKFILECVIVGWEVRGDDSILTLEYDPSPYFDTSKLLKQIVLKDYEKKFYTKDIEDVENILDKKDEAYNTLTQNCFKNVEGLSKEYTDTITTEEGIEKLVTDLSPENTVIQKPTDQDKQQTVDIPSDPARKAPEKITVMGGQRASIMQGKLSQENLEQGSNKKDDYYFDKRPGNAKLNDIYGMQTKLNVPGCIKLYKADSENGYHEPVSIDCFLLQSVQTSLKEKFSIFQSLSGDVLAYFFGKQPVIYRFSAALYNTYNQEWAHDFRNYYEKYLRGSASIGKNIRTVVSYENHVIEGFFLEMNMQESATNTNLVNIDFSILFVQDHVIGYDEPSFNALDTGVFSGGMYDVLTKESILSAPTNFTVTKPEGDESITLSSDTLLRSTPNEIDDNKLKIVKAGETLTINNTPIQGKNGDEWYRVVNGKYKDGERIHTGNPVYIKKDAIKGGSAEDPLANRKTIDLSNPDVANTKLKSDMNQHSKETEQLNKTVENAKEKSKNFNSRLNASVKKDGISIYTAASNQSPVIGTLNKGDRCETLHNEGIYTKIVFNEIVGFVESRKLKIGG